MAVLQDIVISPLQLAAIVAACTLSGAVIGHLASLWNAHLQRRSEEKRQLRELAVRAAVESFKYSFELAKEKAAKSTTRVHLYPLETHIIHMTKVSDLVLNGKLTPETMVKELEQIDRIINAYKEHRLPTKIRTGEDREDVE